jgi:putative two-component system response regulator
MKRWFRHWWRQWTIHTAKSADEAIEVAAREELDAIIVDISMPGKSGFDLLRTLKEDEATACVPVVVLTGLLDESLKREALELGATDLLTKPVSQDDLVARIQNVLAMKEYEDRLRGSNEWLEAEVKRRTASVECSRLDLLWRLAKAGEYRDEQSGQHVQRVGLYCKTIAESMGMPDDFVRNIWLTAPLHDIGKVGVPDAILLKPGRLNPAEFSVMQTHCEIGRDILLQQPQGGVPYEEVLQYSVSSAGDFDNPMLKFAASIAMGHHEKWDGTGYPRGFSGETIPIEARIAAIADVYDALCSPRPYRSAMPHEEVVQLIARESEGHFDPNVIHSFETCADSLRDIHRKHSEPDDRLAA